MLQAAFLLTGDRLWPRVSDDVTATSGPAVREMLDDGLRCEKAGMTERALEHYQSALEHSHDPALISEALRRQAHVYRIRCDWDLAIVAAQDSARAAESARSAELLAEAWNAEAAVYQSRGDFETAIPLYELMLVTVPVGRIRGVALQNLAGIYGTQGRFGEAAHCFEDAYAAFEEAEDRWGMAHVLNNLGGLALDRGELDRAEDTLQRATDLAREIQDLDLLALARLNYAEALLARGDLPKAEIEVSGSLGHFVAAGNQLRRTECLRVLGDIALRQEQIGPARRFYQSGLDTAAAIDARVISEQLAARIAELPPDDTPEDSRGEGQSAVG
jgi:tetratricopeptide (TPR) repeat protein